MKIHLIYKILRRFFTVIVQPLDSLCCRIIFWGNDISYTSFKSIGIPFVSIARGGTCIFGKNLAMNNGAKGNPIGCFDPCTFFVDKDATLIIGDYVGMSQTAIVCHTSIKIGNHVKFGGGVRIYDTDFHSLDHNLRSNSMTDFANKAKKPVIIQNHVFIGAYSLILKGVIIGENSIIGAGSVVTKSVPANQIWAGNPAKFIREI